MALREKLNDDMKAAMKSGDRERLEAVRYLVSLVQGAAKEKQAKEPDAPLDDGEVVTVLQKEAKRRKEAAELFRKGGRADLVEKEEGGLAVIYEYIPKELSPDELEKMVDDVRAKGASDFGSIMREVMKLSGGRADGKTVGEIVKKKMGQ